MKQIFEDSAWKKTLQLIEEKYGKTLQFRSLKLLNDDKKVAYQQGDDLIIPLALKNLDLGNVIIARGSFLTEQQQMEVVDLVKFLLEPQIYNLHLKNTEQNISNQKTNTNREPAQVINLHAETQHTKKPLSQIIHLKSHLAQTRLKVALKIHDMSERNFFVRLNDVITAGSTVEDLLSLQETTVFIEDIESLSEHTLKIVEQFLNPASRANLDDGPLILVGSGLSLESIEKRNWNTQLKNDLMGFYFDIDRVPIAQQTSQEILDLLFFEITDSMS